MKSRRFFLFFLASLTLSFLPSLAFATKIELKDPQGDDKGPGTYTYPTKQDYRAGDFDLTSVTIEERGDTVEFRVRLRTSIRDVWNSKSWDGNGFSVQFVQIYIDTDRKAQSGHCQGLPGLNIRFADEGCWEKVVLLSPQPATKLKSEINLKAEKFKKDIVIPTSTRAQGKQLIAVIPKAALGGSLSKKWGFQVIVQSNEGYPRPKDLLVRPVNEYNGEHRFGGGHDKDCDPHVLDILAGHAKGDATEIALQYKLLSAYSCEGKGKRAVIPMIYPE